MIETRTIEFQDSSHHFVIEGYVAFNHGVPHPKDGSVAAFFATNVADATIDRIEIIPGRVAPTFRVSQLGQLARSGPETKIAVIWVPSLRLRGTMYSDVLLALDGAANFLNGGTFLLSRHCLVSYKEGDD